jgi:V-type H+-transporting ATPase subunit E
MTAFIRQEAMEKANEIRLKADEEFAIEKSKLVRQEQASIDSSYEKKFKQASMSQQITRSTVSNKSRLRILSARQELLNRLFENAEKKLGEVSKDKKKYQSIMKDLILEGAYALNEDKLQVKVRKADYDLTKKAIEEAQTEYKKNIGKEVSITIDESDPLPEGSYVDMLLPIQKMTNSRQRWWCHDCRHKRPNRHQQHLPRTIEATRVPGSTVHQGHTFRREREQEVPRLR